MRKWTPVDDTRPLSARALESHIACNLTSAAVDSWTSSNLKKVSRKYGKLRCRAASLECTSSYFVVLDLAQRNAISNNLPPTVPCYDVLTMRTRYGYPYLITVTVPTTMLPSSRLPPVIRPCSKKPMAPPCGSFNGFNCVTCDSFVTLDVLW